MPTTLDPYRPGLDDGDVLALRAAVWGADHPHTNLAFLDWLFKRNPAGAGSGVLMRRDGKPVAFAGMSARRLLTGERTIRVAHGLDLMVDPAVPGSLSGLYGYRTSSRWAELVRDAGYDFGVNFPNANSIRLLTSDRLGWKIVLSPRLTVRPLRGFNPAELNLGRMPPWLARTVGEALARGLDLVGFLRRRKPVGAPVSIESGDERLDSLWRDATTPSTTGFVRDKDYFRWRYVEHPSYKYKMTGWQVDGELAGVLVTTARRIFGLESLLVVDAVMSTRHRGVATFLLEHTLEQARSEGMQIACAQVCADDQMDAALRSAGFIAVPKRFNPKPFYLVGMAFSPGSEALLSSRNWHFTWGDMDVV